MWESGDLIHFNRCLNTRKIFSLSTDMHTIRTETTPNVVVVIVEFTREEQKNNKLRRKQSASELIAVTDGGNSSGTQVLSASLNRVICQSQWTTTIMPTSNWFSSWLWPMAHLSYLRDRIGAHISTWSQHTLVPVTHSLRCTQSFGMQGKRHCNMHNEMRCQILRTKYENAHRWHLTLLFCVIPIHNTFIISTYILCMISTLMLLVHGTVLMVAMQTHK